VEPEPEEPPLPPLHQAAYDAIERDDLDAAATAYEQALRENPRDEMARAGLAQVGLLSRTRDADLAAVRTAAADAPHDVDAQLAVADLDVLGGQVQDAFDRLIDVIRSTAGPERERVRVRLVELFEVVGAEDPRVPAARRALASALY
jgi:putative thioredoxin